MDIIRLDWAGTTVMLIGFAATAVVMILAALA
jgi:hypothetical protein